MIRIVVVDDHLVVRQGLMSILRYEADMEVVGEAADGEEAVRVIAKHQPDVVVLDLQLPKLSGVEVMKQARSQSSARYLVLTTYDTEGYIMPALAAGAQGYLLKDATSEELLYAVRMLARGGASIEAGVAATYLEGMSDGKREDELSARERDVLRLLVMGAGNKAIAARLNVSENTVKSHLSHIFEKLGVKSRAEAVSVALQRSLIELKDIAHGEPTDR